MVPRETSQFWFPESPDVSQDKVEGKETGNWTIH